CHASLARDVADACFFFSSRRRHTRLVSDWSSDVCSSDLNMLERERLESKKISKTSAVTSIIPYALREDDVHVGPSDYVPWLKDRKWCHIRMEGTTFGDVPLNLEVKLEVWDSPNSAGVVIDAVRCARLA